MSLIPWNDSYSVGVPEIDKQHRKLFLLVDDVFAASKDPYKSKDDVGQIVDELVSYVEYHFACEQKYLLNHPEFAAHRATHAGFVLEVIRFVKKVQTTDEDALVLELLKYLIDWLQEHILETDREYFQYLIKHNLLP